MNTVTTPDSLRQARRELESVPGYRLLEDWSWLPSLHRWALRFRLSCALPDTSPIPGETDWVVSVSSAYPWGDITVYPAKENGIIETFPHQSLNKLGLPALPNRTGGLCLGIMTQAWQIRHGLSEPHTVEQRLKWHLERTAEWIDRAGRQLLFQPGDDWEAPARSYIATAPHIVIGRTASSLSLGGTNRHGIVEILLPQPNLNVLFADRFIGVTEEALRASRELGLGLALGQTEWGALVSCSTLASYGIWIRLAKTPVMPHWRLPSTWGELREWYQTHEGSSLDSKMADALRRGETVAKHVAFLLIGYPVPLRFGEQPARLQWEACSLEGLSEDAASLGFPDAKPLKWATVYSNRDLMSQVRGQFGVGLCHSSVLMIGAGALGSITAELLTRGGLRQLCIVDSEALQLGNLVRHTLTVFSVGHNKAAAVAARLNASSLDAKVTAYQGKLSSQTLPALMAREPDIVLDTTGSDQVLSDLAGWRRPTLFLSISLGLHARRIYAYATRGEGFPVEDFHSKIQPWLKQDHEDTKDLPQPATEGIGCWSPVFPARLDDIYLLASAAVKWIEEVAAQPLLDHACGFRERQRVQSLHWCAEGAMTAGTAPFPNGTADCPVDLRLHSADRRFGIYLPKHCLRSMLDYAARDYPKETGGVLLGTYTPSFELAIVTEVSGPPDDSKKARSGFWRGILGLQTLISRLWKEQQYYLGEWHVHPDGPPIPSATDHDQMNAISGSPAYQCPEPLLLILGYSRESFPHRWSADSYVFPRCGNPVALNHPDLSGRAGT